MPIPAPVSAILPPFVHGLIHSAPSTKPATLVSPLRLTRVERGRTHRATSARSADRQTSSGTRPDRSFGANAPARVWEGPAAVPPSTASGPFRGPRLGQATAGCSAARRLAYTPDADRTVAGASVAPDRRTLRGRSRPPARRGGSAPRSA